MRLTKLKLSGFKSFVDPTVVALPGQLVGVVGPNGCGKSNIMDAVRWVLGESKASELRGESMQDVIFNGSTHRKPVARASVELVFDNALGRALGQWSQYAELAVKRVLTRNGQSDYFINNLKVRRKDITDLFLGTGLGPRAYAIIGQGMISRIIEARPDDLRVFLEEAAGVTRYKERRKETEGRLEDTRENLVRVEDIRQELSLRMEKLETQAEVARQYHEFNDALIRKQRILWLARQGEALAERERLGLAVEQAITAQEGAVAMLRETEARLESAREEHLTAGDTLHRAQSELYAANAEVVRLETEIRHRKEARRQVETRLAQLSGEQAHWTAQAEKLANDRGRWEELQELAAARQAQAAAKSEMVADHLPQVEENESRARAAVESLRRNVTQMEQRLQVELAHRSHAERNLQTLIQRHGRLQEEAANLSTQETERLSAEIAAKEEERMLAAAAQDEIAERLAALRERLPRLHAEWKEAAELAERRAREAAALEARRGALEQLQAQEERARQGERLPDWLARYELAGLPPLWKALRVAPGWEMAVEAVLRERLNALPMRTTAHLPAWEADRPGGKVSLRLGTGEAVTEEGTWEILPGSLREKVTLEDEGWRAALDAWLGRVRTAADLAAALRERDGLPAGVSLVTPAGDVVEREALHLFAPEVADASIHGLLERRREIEALSLRLDERREEAGQSREKAAALEEAHRALDENERQLRREQEEAAARLHALQMEILRCAQALERQREQAARVGGQLDEMTIEIEAEREREFAAGEVIEQLREQLQHLREEESDARLRLEEAERALRDAREQAAAIEREAREAEFSARECGGKLAEIVSQLALSERELLRIETGLAECRTQQLETPPEIFEEGLRQALEKRQREEEALALCREALEAATSGLKALEEQRLRLEQGLEPLRERIGELKLKEQAAALSAEQLAEQLAEAGCDEAMRAALAEEAKTARPQALAQEIGRLQKAIAELGAVNLAALEELQTSRERKDYLDEQATDLTEAMETLEAAIRRIDRETRDLLQNTFDTVNAHFGRLFPELFGGGKAALVMTGEEILDAGVQVFAQPPGKKNSTIHLLSGGEKALTAIALVFSMFQLNPAPFCLLDEVDAPLDDSNTERFSQMVRKMSGQTQFLFISHNKISMEMAEQLVGVTMQESGVSRVVEVDMEAALKMREEA